MGGLVSTIKKFFTNKTTVTIVGVVASIAILVGFYIYRVNTAINPQKVPVATRDLKATDQITEADIKYVKINKKFLNKKDIFTASIVNKLIDKYVSVGTSIPKGGLFYQSQVVEKKELPNAIFDEIPDGYTIYQLKVNNEKTFANSIYPGDIIDLYLTTTDSGKLVFGKFITNIKVLAVRDSAGNNVFDVTSGRTPAWLLFAVETDMYQYLKIAEFAGIEIMPNPSNNFLSEDIGTTEYSNEQIKTLIDKVSSTKYRLVR